MHRYSETFWNLFSDTPPAINFRRSDGEGAETEGEERGVAFNKFVRALPLAIPSYTVESSPLYLFKQKVNKPSSTFNQLEREAIPPPLQPRAIFNTKVSSRKVRNSTFGYICAVSFPQS